MAKTKGLATTFYIPKKLKEWVRLTAFNYQVSQAMFIRFAIKCLYDKWDPQDRELMSHFRCFEKDEKFGPVNVKSLKISTKVEMGVPKRT